MMKLTPEAIQEFQDAYRKDFGLEVSKEEAEQLGLRLITLFSVIYKPIPKNGNENGGNTGGSGIGIFPGNGGSMARIVAKIHRGGTHRIFSRCHRGCLAGKNHGTSRGM
ncbi:MAG: hypothetical protein WC651_02795 [Candidatus Gracilibacteria bacterium]